MRDSTLSLRFRTLELLMEWKKIFLSFLVSRWGFLLWPSKDDPVWSHGNCRAEQSSGRQTLGGRLSSLWSSSRLCVIVEWFGKSDLILWPSVYFLCNMWIIFMPIQLSLLWGQNWTLGVEFSRELVETHNKCSKQVQQLG